MAVNEKGAKDMFLDAVADAVEAERDAPPARRPAAKAPARRPAAGVPVRRLGNLFIALVVWCAGAYLTRQMLPPAWGGAVLWGAAIVGQLALTIGQTNQRERGWRDLSPSYVALILVDVGVNAVGILTQMGQVHGIMDVVPYGYRAAVTGEGAWQIGGAVVLGALVAALPEELIRDAH